MSSPREAAAGYGLRAQHASPTISLVPEAQVKSSAASPRPTHVLGNAIVCLCRAADRSLFYCKRSLNRDLPGLRNPHSSIVLCSRSGRNTRAQTTLPFCAARQRVATHRQPSSTGLLQPRLLQDPQATEHGFMPAKHKPRSKQGLQVEKGSCGTLISRAATMGTAQDSRLPVRTQKLLVAKQQVGDANRRPERHSPALSSIRASRLVRI